MASLPTRSFTGIVQTIAAGIQGRASALIDFSIGSPLRAIAESFAGVALWLESLALQILTATRAATSSGADLDTFMADFGLTRLGASASVGQVTFSRFTAGAQAVIPIGATVQSADGTQSYFVTIDATNTAYNAGLSGYVVPVGITSIAVPVMAVTPGGGGNAVAGSVTVMTSVIPFIDQVTNAANFASGADQETDYAFRLRFRMFIASLSKGTLLAVGYAITSLKLGMAYSIVENKDRDGTPHYGFFYVVADDGSGTPPTPTMTTVYAAVDAVRAAGVWFAVFPPTLVIVTPSLSISVAAGYDVNATVAAVSNAILGYINAITVGRGLAWSKLVQLAYEASPGVVNVSGVTVNGRAGDIWADPNVRLIAGPIVVTGS